jgi:hypothetical protein
VKKPSIIKSNLNDIMMVSDVIDSIITSEDAKLLNMNANYTNQSFIRLNPIIE